MLSGELVPEPDGLLPADVSQGQVCAARVPAVRAPLGFPMANDEDPLGQFAPIG
jgi:hypothetical protein